MTFPDISWLALLPVLVVTASGFLVLLADLFVEGPDREGLGWIGILGFAVTAITSALLWNTHESGFGGAVIVDRYALFFDVLFSLAASLTLLMSMDYLESIDVRCGEFYALVLFGTAGMVLMASATDLIVLFLGLEVMSIAAYVLAGIWRSELRSSEGAVKYFLLGAFATGFLLFGIALLYGAFATTALGPITAQLGAATGEQKLLALAGMGLLLIGFAFKIAAVPFHAWAPDVYEGAPTSITALMAVGVKAAAFAAFARVFLHHFASVSVDWTGVLWVLAALTMTFGNVAALLQRNIKRMLAYSSIAHAGYLLVGMVAAGEAGGAAVLYYLFAYALMNLGAFAVVIAVGRRGELNELIDDFAGIGFRYPFLGFAMTVFMLSLAGIPALAGFTGKFYLFSAAVKSGYVGLAVIGVLNSVVSVYYYVGVLVRMFMVDAAKEVQGTSHRPYLLATLLVTVAGTVFLGIFPSWAFDLARSAFHSLG
jgi:NADH-quinone oxidoreductase subunit N